MSCAQAEHSCLRRWLAEQLASLQHANKQPVARIYGAHRLQGTQAVHAASAGAVAQGPTVTFNLLRADGSFVGYG